MVVRVACCFCKHESVRFARVCTEVDVGGGHMRMPK